MKKYELLERLACAHGALNMLVCMMRLSDENTLRDVVDNAEVIDTVPVVRCKDCWLRGKFPRCPMVDIDCTGHGFIDKSIDDGFCNFGKRNGVYEQ